MGGVPSVERNPVQQSHDLTEMLEHALAFEQGAADLYKEALELAEGDRALVVLLEDILLEEQDGVDEMTQLLREQKEMAGKSAGASSKAG